MRQDLDLLQGTWTVAALEMDGQSMPADMLGDARIVIDGSRFIGTGMGAVYEGALALDASTTPARIDMQFDAGPEKGNTNLGIYQLDGDSWKLCMATRGTVRPASFTSPPGSGIAVETLVRGMRQESSQSQEQGGRHGARRTGDGVRRRVAHAFRGDERKGHGRIGGPVGQTRDAGKSDHRVAGPQLC